MYQIQPKHKLIGHRGTAGIRPENTLASFSHAAKIGLGLNAGHDLNLDNLARFRTVPQLLEVSIGHALTVDAIAMGLDKAVRAYKQLCVAR